MSANRITLGQPRLNADQVAEIVARFTPRDYDILSYLHEHRVLTTHQIEKIFFTLPQPTRRRMSVLLGLNAVARFRPWTPHGGSTPSHWVLGRAGAAVLALRQDITVKELGYHPDTTLAISMSSKLGHQLGVNDFFAQLHQHARRATSGAQVKEWWSERRCAKLWGDLARPDAYGRWAENGREIDFFLEHDTGSETRSKVAAKLTDYANLADATGITTPLLLWLPSHARESNLRQLISSSDLPVATAVHTSLGDGPAGAVWLPLGAEQPRLRLAELVNAWPHLIAPRNEAEMR
ncbi:replication-relaxation family protein [Nonomuraea glycinis]|uniref:replication-relaxation family protein n=1 Tax=Nonomuraea glycinis TaxID=2047744 RepID=UPI0033A4A9D1